MHILVTRPEEDADALRRPLEAMGHRVSAAALMQIDYLPVSSAVIEGAAGLIATSRNGLRALSLSKTALELARNLPVFTVGPATAAFAKDLGFKTVFEGAGTAEQLADVIEAEVNPTHGPLVHLAGKDVAFDLGGALRGLGYLVSAPGVYRSTSAIALPPQVAAGLRAGTFDAVALLSPKTAETFARLAAPVLKAPNLRQPAYLCLSEAVASRLSPLPAARQFIAIRPNLAEIVILAAELQA